MQADAPQGSSKGQPEGSQLLRGHLIEILEQDFAFGPELVLARFHVQALGDDGIVMESLHLGNDLGRYRKLNPIPAVNPLDEWLSWSTK